MGTDSVQIIRLILKKPLVNIKYPKAVGMKNKNAEAGINQAIKNELENMINELKESSETMMEGTYKITLNEEGLLSLILEVYSYTKGMAHGITLRRSLTFNSLQGTQLEFSQLFKKGSYYKTKLIRMLREFLKQTEAPLITPISAVGEDQQFFLTQDALILFYQPYEYTPYSFGFLEVPIRYSQISDLLGGGALTKFIGK